jgi:hypothetical protein
MIYLKQCQHRYARTNTIRCDNVTAFLSSSKPLLLVPAKSPFETFENPELNLFLTSPGTKEHNENSPLWDPALKQVLSNSLIDALHGLEAITKLLNTSPKLSEHDMLVYDRRRASIQHQLSNVAIPPLTAELFHTTESFRLATVIYSILALWGFVPPMKLYGDLAKMLYTSLRATDHVCDWGIWWELLLWTLFIGGHATLGRQERIWFSIMIRETLRGRSLTDWPSVRKVLDLMPVYHTLWEPFQTLWLQAVSPGGPEASTVGNRELSFIAA